MSPAGALAAPRLATATTRPPLRGAALTVDVIEDAALAWDDEGVLSYVGPRRGLPADGPAPEHVPEGTWLAPGFVDPHTHLPFVGWRADEYAARLAGATYAGVQGEGGGIPRSARMLAAASDEEVLGFAETLAAEMLAHGTTAFECKTGYGDSVEAELRQARLARALGGRVAQTTTVTLLACHAVPSGWSRAAWVEAATSELIPAAAAEGLVDAVDIYVEPSIAFTLEDLARVAAAALAHGLPLRVHADQLEDGGATAAAVAAGARAADHLNHASAAGVTALAAAETAAVLLPASTFCLGAAPAPARALVDAGAIVAVGTDANPGTSPVVSVPETIAIGCRLYGLAPVGALAAATANAAWVLGLDDRLGRLAPGLRADVLILEGDGPDHLAYRPGHDPVLGGVVGGMRMGPAGA
ncbi:MAG TPA: imidazolonepropionase [Actinomycetota bacterium]|nr:imidazolonepropionase [Actinomycetota bacterium]